jgi:hypothetical protein
MSRLPSILFAALAAYASAGSAIAQPVGQNPSTTLAPLLQENRLIGDVARDDPDNLWNVVRQIHILMRTPRDSGAARTVAAPTESEAAQIAANPALRLGYENDPAATLVLLQSTNKELIRARLRGDQDQPKRVALVVGSRGDGVWGKLATTKNDANLIANALTQQGFAVSGGNALIDPDKARLLQAIRAFARSIDPGTIALFYYAGHGIQAHARNFIVPSGAAIPQTDDDYDRDLVALDDVVLRQMQQAHGRLNILVLDACRDHPSLPSPSTTRPLVNGLAPMGAPSATSGTMIIYSTGPNSIARDAMNGEADSPFATAFAAAVGAGGLEIRDIFDRVQASVDQASNHLQQPWISYSTADKFYFNTTRAPVDPSPRDMLDSSGALCPKPGTRVTLIDAGHTVTATYGSVDPAMPALCHLSTSNGQDRTLLYNLYDTKTFYNQATASGALRDLLSGRKDRVEFKIRLRTQYPFTPFQESWTRLGETSIEIDDRHVEAIVFEHDTEAQTNGIDGYHYHRRWKLWYDPVVGVIRERELSVSDAGNSRSLDETRAIVVSPF